MALPPVTETVAIDRRIHQPPQEPLGFFLVIGRDGKVLVLEPGILAPWALERISDAQKKDTGNRGQKTISQTHRANPASRIAPVLLSPVADQLDRFLAVSSVLISSAHAVNPP